ncbi:MAG: MraY family glycosyltransferase [Polyangiaceae bacterium]
MNALSLPFLSALVGASAGALATGLMRSIARAAGWVAQPNPLVPQHRAPTALLGGLGIVSGYLLSIATTSRQIALEQLGLLLPVAGYLLLGTIDDMRPLRAGTKLAWQSALALAAVMLGVRAPLSNNGLIDGLASACWIVLMVNAVNVTDVCDGLAAGVASVGFIALGIWDPATAPLSWALAGACVGFLSFNRPNASIFMGDAGSLSLGYLLAGFSLRALGHSGGWHGAIKAVAAGAVFLFEVAFLIAMRRRKGLPFWRGSRDHFSLRMQAAGFSKWRTNIISWAAAALACLAATFAGSVSAVTTLAMVLTACGVTACAGLWLSRHEVR